MTTIAPPADLRATAVPQVLRSTGQAVLMPHDFGELIGADINQLDALRAGWNDLPPDTYLKDGGHYRRRRHSCFVVDGDRVTQAPHRAHWQPVDYNALHGGIERWFEPMAASIVAAPVWTRMLVALGSTFSAASSAQPWFVEAHQFRIDTTDGIGRPTPEGAHRDGVDFVVVALIDRVGVKGGETRVFEAEGTHGTRFTMTERWTTLLLDDARVIHESTPIQPIADEAHRDTLVLTYRARGFQGP